MSRNQRPVPEDDLGQGSRPSFGNKPARTERSVFDDIATLLRELPEQEDLVAEIRRLARQASAACTPTIALEHAMDDLNEEVLALVREARGTGNVSRMVSALAKLETLRLMCG